MEPIDSLIKPIDTRMRRAWPQFWSHQKLKDIREEVGAELVSSSHAAFPAGLHSQVDTPEHLSVSKRVREETRSRWEAFCRIPRDLDGYKAEVARRSGRRSFKSIDEPDEPAPERRSFFGRLFGKTGVPRR